MSHKTYAQCVMQSMKQMHTVRPTSRHFLKSAYTVTFIAKERFSGSVLVSIKVMLLDHSLAAHRQSSRVQCVIFLADSLYLARYWALEHFSEVWNLVCGSRLRKMHKKWTPWTCAFEVLQNGFTIILSHHCWVEVREGKLYHCRSFERSHSV